MLNILFTLVAATFIWLTVRRGATDPVCGMRVDRHAIEHAASAHGRRYFFCSAACRQTFEADPERYAADGGRPAGATS